MSYDGSTYTVQIGEQTRYLPFFEVAPNVKIAIFNMLGDTEIVEAAAKDLARQIPAQADVLVVPEVKAVPLGHVLSAHTGLPYVVARKFRKPYMVNCVETEVLSITTGEPQTLYLDGKDRELVEDKNVVLLDDVISTGGTLKGLYALAEQLNANVVGEMAVFTEGDEGSWPHVISLGRLPILTD